MQSKILLLEDDHALSETMKDFLEEESFSVDSVYDPYSAYDKAYKNHYDCYLLDVNLPYESGFDMLKKLRASGDTTPAIFITSRNDKGSLVEGYEVGADDYLKKPVDLDELHCRIEALLRRKSRVRFINIKDYQFDIHSKQLFKDNVEMDISTKAGRLLQVLIEANNSVVSSSELKEKIWSSHEGASEGSLRVYITQLKKYFGDDLQNIRGVGYCLKR
jgi:DNA-binding response OmpR family regulator